MEKIGLPKISEEKINDRCSKFTVEPLYPGYGPTIGNALRRVLLSSITGAAATSFKIEGVNHEFTSIPHAKEDVIELMLNLKGINFKSFSDEPVVLELSKKGPNKITAKDFKANSKIEILNPEAPILTLDNKADFYMEVIVEKDRGFRPVSVAGETKKEIGRIGIDANFSPIERVSLSIEDTRVGQMTNYDKIILEITTNGSVEPRFALKESSKVLVDHYNSIISDASFDLDLTTPFEKIVETTEETGEYLENTEEDGSSLDSKVKIEDLNLSQRTTNALINSGVKTYGGLKRLTPLKLEEVKGLGKKGIEEINAILG